MSRLGSGKLSLEGKRVAVIGMARSGIGAARLVHRLGGRALISDMKPAASLQAAINELAGTGVDVETGAHERVGTEDFDLVVLSPGVVPPHHLSAHWTTKNVPVWSELELASRVCDVPWIGVTGSNGKTTTVHLLHDILWRAGMNAFVTGNVGNAWSNFLPAESDHRFVVEVSSFQLEYAPTVRPHVAVLLNLFENHLDRHGSMETYAELKSRLFRNQTAENIAVVNGEDDWTSRLASRFQARVVRFGTRPEFDFWTDGDSLWGRINGQNKLLIKRRELPLIGRHNDLNALAAAAAAYHFGAEFQEIGIALKHAKPVEHRIEFVAEISGVRYINDSKSTNMVATQTALNAFSGKVILLFGGRPKKESFAPLTVRFSNPVKALIVYGEAVEKVKRELETGSPVQYVETMRDALKIANRVAEPGDVVLLSPGCTSFDQFKDYEERGREFKVLVKDIS